jgi:insulysin
MEIIKSEYDKRKYKNIILDNNLEVVIVHDELADISAASMIVNIGYFSDGKTYGLAHFLEHMLFMGSKKYPTEDKYQTYLQEHGGHSNAYTSMTQTCYFFEVQSDFIFEALDIFAQFFISPSFDKKSIEREVNAIDSEHKKNLNSDQWRYYDVLRELANKKHPFSNFSTGTLETLKNGNVYNELISFYNKYYSSNIMKLVVISNKSIDIIEKNIRQIFSKVPNQNVVIDEVLGPAINTQNKNGLVTDFATDPDTVSYIIQIVPIMKENKICIQWQLPTDIKHFKYKPLEYITYVLSHRGPNSLYNLLYTRDLVMDIDAGVFDSFYDQSIYLIIIKLTDLGYKYRHIISNMIYNYLSSLEKNGIEEWIYDQMKTEAEIKFNFSEKNNSIDSVTMISENLLKYPTKYCVSVNTKYAKCDTEFIKIVKIYLGQMTKYNSVIVFSSANYASITQKTSKWYGVKYNVYKNAKFENVDDFLITNLKNLRFEFGKNYDLYKQYLPIKNNFIPKNVSIYEEFDCKKSNSNTSIYPNIHETENGLKYYFKYDNIFKKPIIYVGIVIKPYVLLSNVKHYMLCNMYFNILDQLLVSDLYYTSLVLSNINFNVGRYHIKIIINGFSDNIIKIINLLHKTIDSVQDFKEPQSLQSIFTMEKQKYKEYLINKIFDQPYSLSYEKLSEISVSNYFTYQDQLELIDSIELTEVINMYEKIFSSKNDFRYCIQGSISNIEANNIIDVVGSVQKKEEYKKNLNTNTNDSIVKNLVRADLKTYMSYVPNSTETNSAINIVFQFFTGNKQKKTNEWYINRCKLSLIEQIMKEAFFDQLRTKEQLGYIVKSSTIKIGNPENSTYGLSFVIQSAKATPDELYKRVMSFTKKFYDELKTMTNDTYKTHIDSAIRTATKKNDTLLDEFGSNYNEVVENTYIFDIYEIYAQTYKTISKKILCEYYYDNIYCKKKRAVWVIGLYGKNHSSCLETKD